MALRNFLDVVFPLFAPAFIFKIIFLKKMALFFIGVTSHPRMGTSLMDAPGFAPLITVISRFDNVGLSLAHSGYRLFVYFQERCEHQCRESETTV